VAIRRIEKGDVIGIALNAAATGLDGFLDQLAKKFSSAGVAVVPVHVSHPDVKFGAVLPLATSVETIRQSIEATGKGDED
jgi:hypothetical protein